MTGSNVSRRTVLATGGFTVLTGGVLTGCSTTSSKAAATVTSSTTEASSAESATTPTAVTATAPAPSGTAVAKLADIPVGGSISATLSGKPIVLAQPTAGKVVGFSAICTHQGCTVKAAGKQLDCPCHGSQFDAATGAVLQGPAQSPLPALTVSVSGASVYASAQA